MITDAATLPTVGSQFRPGTIHESSYRSFWKDELKAGNWVMEVLANGYVIPFEYSPLHTRRKTTGLLNGTWGLCDRRLQSWKRKG